MAGPIETLKQTRWWEPTLRKFAAHALANRSLGCAELRERFTTFAAEVLNTPEGARDSILAIDRVESIEPPARRYRQYDQPIPKEMKIGTVTKRRK